MTGALVSSLLNGSSGSGGGVSTKKVIIKSATLPAASEKTLGAMYIYAGEDTTDLKHGYIYEGRSITANTKEVEFSTNTISCSSTDFWELVKTLAPSNYTEIVKGEMVLVGGNTWRIVGRNTNDEQVLSYQQYDTDFESAGFVFNGTFSEGDTVPFVCEINETAATQYVWRRIDVQPSSSKGQIIAVDAELSPTSENPVQNKAIAGALGVDWVKPDDWPDIRSAALPNSMYFLVGHAADYSSYSSFVFKATVSNSGSYDVYVDGIKQATTANNTDTTLDWQTLALTSGWDVTYPFAMRTHIVRVTPSVGTNKITGIYYTGDSDGAALWMHNTVDGIFALGSLSGKAWNTGHLVLLEAITTVGEQIATNGVNQAFADCTSLKELPVLDFTNNIADLYRAFLNCTSIKKIKLQNLKGNGTTSCFNNCVSLEEIKAQNSYIKWSTSIFEGCAKLKSLGELQISSSDNFTTNSLKGCVSLSELFLDMSNNPSMTRLTFGGSSDKRIDGLKSLTVSPEAPFSNAASPQIDVSYTGLNKAALVNLFNSMPYNVGYTLVGTPTVSDGVASEFSDSNYLKLSSSFSEQGDIDIVVKITTDSDLNVNQYPLSWDAKPVSSYRNSGLYVISGGKYGCVISDTEDHLSQYTAPSANALSANTTYYLRLLFKAADKSLKMGSSTDGINYIYGINQTLQANMCPMNRNNISIGRAMPSNYYFRGSIDLNETYIKVNGKPFFRGTAAVTKTVSVVGCSGTEDLTAEDKAIAEDKGWAITLS